MKFARNAIIIAIFAISAVSASHYCYAQDEDIESGITEPDGFSPDSPYKQPAASRQCAPCAMTPAEKIIAEREAERKAGICVPCKGSGEKMIEAELAKADKQAKIDAARAIECAKVASEPVKTVAQAQVTNVLQTAPAKQQSAPAKDEIINAEEGSIVDQAVATDKAQREEAAKAAPSAPKVEEKNAEPAPVVEAQVPAPQAEPAQAAAPAEPVKEEPSIAPPSEQDLTEEILREASEPVAEKPAAPIEVRQMTAEEREHLRLKIIQARKMLAELKGEEIAEAPPLPEPPAATVEELPEGETKAAVAPAGAQKPEAPAQAKARVEKPVREERVWFGLGKTKSQVEEEKRVKLEKLTDAQRQRMEAVRARDEERARQRQLAIERRKAANAPRMREQELMKELKKLEAERKKKIKDLERILKEYERKHKLGII